MCNINRKPLEEEKRQPTSNLCPLRLSLLLFQGDSGFAVYRQRSLLAKSRPLQHYFDCPLQFGAFPEYVEATDTSDMADLYSIALQPGDVIVSGEFQSLCRVQAQSTQKVV